MKLLVAILLSLAFSFSSAQENDRDLEIWRSAIVSKISRLVDLPPNAPTKARAAFRITQQLTGEIVSIMLLSSSGIREVDEAVMRAIQKSSPLPRPGNPALFTREIEIVWKYAK